MPTILRSIENEIQRFVSVWLKYLNRIWRAVSSQKSEKVKFIKHCLFENGNHKMMTSLESSPLVPTGLDESRIGAGGQPRLTTTFLYHNTLQTYGLI